MRNACRRSSRCWARKVSNQHKFAKGRVLVAGRDRIRAGGGGTGVDEGGDVAVGVPGRKVNCTAAGVVRDLHERPHPAALCQRPGDIPTTAPLPPLARRREAAPWRYFPGNRSRLGVRRRKGASVSGSSARLRRGSIWCGSFSGTTFVGGSIAQLPRPTGEDSCYPNGLPHGALRQDYWARLTPTATRRMTHISASMSGSEQLRRS